MFSSPRTSSDTASQREIVPVRPITGPAAAPNSAPDGLQRLTPGRYSPSRRTFGRGNASRRTFGRSLPSRRTFGLSHP